MDGRPRAVGDIRVDLVVAGAVLGRVGYPPTVGRVSGTIVICLVGGDLEGHPLAIGGDRVDLFVAGAVLGYVGDTAFLAGVVCVRCHSRPILSCSESISLLKEASVQK